MTHRTSAAERAEKEEHNNTETNLTVLRQTVHLTMHSAFNSAVCARKLIKIKLKPGEEITFCQVFLDCCAEKRTYDQFFGLVGNHLCAIKIYSTSFEKIFQDSYQTIHRLDTNSLRNVSTFFANLLFANSISWSVLSHLKLNEEDTTSSGRVFVKILFQELLAYMGLSELKQRVKDVTLQEVFEGLFPRDDPKNTRFSINFFTSIGLGGLTDDLREHLKAYPIVPTLNESSSSDESTSLSSSSSSSPNSESDTSSSSSSSENEVKKTKKTKKKQKKKKKKQKSKNSKRD